MCGPDDAERHRRSRVSAFRTCYPSFYVFFVNRWLRTTNEIKRNVLSAQLCSAVARISRVARQRRPQTPVRARQKSERKKSKQNERFPLPAMARFQRQRRKKTPLRCADDKRTARPVHSIHGKLLRKCAPPIGDTTDPSVSGQATRREQLSGGFSPPRMGMHL